MPTEEWNDVYDASGNPTGRIHRRGTPWAAGEYGLVVCVWVYDGRGRLLLTRRAPEKSYPGTWENSGGAAQAGEDSRTAIARELYEETGIRATPEEFAFLGADRDKYTHYHFYALHRRVPLRSIRLQPGETDAVMWASYAKIRWMIYRGMICRTIAHQYLRQEAQLRNLPKPGP